MPKKNVYVYKIKLNKSVAQLKKRIEKRGHCIEFKKQQLYYRAMKLPDDESLAACGLEAGSELGVYVDDSIVPGSLVECIDEYESIIEKEFPEYDRKQIIDIRGTNSTLKARTDPVKGIIKINIRKRFEGAMSDIQMTIPNQVTIKDLKSSIFEKIHKIPVDKQMLWHKPGEDCDFKDEELADTKTL